MGDMFFIINASLTPLSEYQYPSFNFSTDWG